MSCCPPSSGSQATTAATRDIEACRSARQPDKVEVAGGIAWLGTANAHIRSDGESPLRQLELKPFQLSSGTITQAEFAAFVADTGYVTDAERLGWSFVFDAQLPRDIGDTERVPGAPWWHRIDGANWKAIVGPGSSLSDSGPDHPVVHVSWHDARAYCSWIGGRLPTEAEWEHAARGGLGDVKFPWGDDEPDDDNYLPCNIWQGVFPRHNSQRDGYASTAPVHSFAPNAYGLYNLVGNVWEWTEDSFSIPARRVGNDYRPAQHSTDKLAKGGSFLCHRSYCYRYRIAARIANTADSTTTHMGFRVAWDG